jgi:hypothetical protein
MCTHHAAALGLSGYLDCEIDDQGATALAEALKMNTSITYLGLARACGRVFCVPNRV